jgi:hypothetical protein
MGHTQLPLVNALRTEKGCEGFNSGEAALEVPLSAPLAHERVALNGRPIGELRGKLDEPDH